MNLLAWLATPAGLLSFAAGCFVFVALCETLKPATRLQFRRGQRWPANILLYGANHLVSDGTARLVVLIVVALHLPRGSGWLGGLELPLAWSALITLLVMDLAQYAMHRLMHAIPAGWRVHRLHHSDRDFDVGTAQRFHPLETIVETPIRVTLVLGLGIPWEALTVYVLTGAVVNHVTHANLALPPRLDRVLRTVLVTPAVHRVHHSLDMGESETNFAVILTLWDRLFGTYRAPPAAPVATGVAEIPARSAFGFGQALLMPFQSFPRTAAPRARRRRATDPASPRVATSTSP